MNITADAVKQLRERTGAGMMECKKALVETKGDLDAAAELMRKQGLAKADKKATRVAAEGVDRGREVRRRPCGRHGRGQLRDRLRRARAGLPRLRRRRWPRMALAGQARPRSRRCCAAKLPTRRDASMSAAARWWPRSARTSACAASRCSTPTGHLGAYVHGTRIGALVARRRAASRHSRTIWPCTSRPATRSYRHAGAGARRMWWPRSARS